MLSLCIEKEGIPEPLDFDGKFLGGAVKIAVPAVKLSGCEGLYTDDIPGEKHCTAKAVPYYAWGNRGVGQMRVWLPVC